MPSKWLANQINSFQHIRAQLDIHTFYFTLACLASVSLVTFDAFGRAKIGAEAKNWEGGGGQRKKSRGLRASVSFAPLLLSESYEINTLQQAKCFIWFLITRSHVTDNSVVTAITRSYSDTFQLVNENRARAFLLRNLFITPYQLRPHKIYGSRKHWFNES